MLPNTISQDRGKDWTSLHEASANGNEEMVKTLLAGNGDISAKETKLGNTPLHEAASRGFSRTVKLLCTPKPTTKPTTKSKQKKDEAPKQTSRGPTQNAMLSIQNFAGFTALHLAAQNGHNQSCRELLLAGANADVENYYGDTALHTACRYGHAGAARILISAYCDVNKKNLNGDTPLHITSAMGRHKLSRILLEAECELNTRNSQCETPRDIAIRKGFGKILDILDNPHRLRNKKSKPAADEEDKTRGGACASKSHSNEVSWSPYGCHYFPDMRAFPSPKLETLPKEPLKRGEQYYLDLAGHIRKGPIGIGNICYCGPFFKHIEDKINSNKRHLRKYVHNAKEHLDDKVQALAARTNHQIEKLTRTMIAERVECENRRIYLEQYLKRGGPLRLTADVTSKGKEAREMLDTLKRSRSLEFLEKVDVMESKMANSRSFDLLDASAHEAAAEVPLRGEEAHCCPHAAQQREHQLSAKPDDEFYDVSKRLGNLLAKTSTFLKVPPPAKTDTHYGQQPAPTFAQALGVDTSNDAATVCTRLENMHLSPSASDASNVTPAQMSSETGAVSSPDYHRNYCTQLAAAKRKGIVASPDEMTTTASSTAATSPGEHPHRDKQLEYLYDIQKRGNVIQNVISALRKSHQRTDALLDVQTRNESEYQQEDKLGYKDELFHVQHLTDNDSREAAMLKEVGLPLEHINAREPYKLKQQTKFESQTRDYVCSGNTQGLLTTTEHMPQSALGVRYQDSSYTESHPGEDGLDSLEHAQQQQQVQYTSSQSSPLYAPHAFEKKFGSTSSKAADSPDSQNYVFQTNYWPERYVPKDAYFHDLSQRKFRSAQAAAHNVAANVDERVGLTNAVPRFNVANAVKSIESLNGQALSNTYIRDPTARSSIPSAKSRLHPAAPKTNGCVECADPVCNGNCIYDEQTTHTVNEQHSPHALYTQSRRVSQPIEAGNFTVVTQPTNLSETRIVTTAAVHNGGSYSYGRDESDALVGGKTRLPASGYYASNVSSLV